MRFVGDETVRGIGLAQKILERVTLQGIEACLTEGRRSGVLLLQHVSHPGGVRADAVADIASLEPAAALAASKTSTHCR